MITVKHLETQTYVLLYMLYWQNLHILKVQLTIWRSWNRHLMCGTEIVIFVLYYRISAHILSRLKSSKQVHVEESIVYLFPILTIYQLSSHNLITKNRICIYLPLLSLQEKHYQVYLGLLEVSDRCGIHVLPEL